MLKSKILKLYRFILLYGFQRTLIKAASRSMNVKLKYFVGQHYSFKKDKSVSLIGTGQFGFATISYLVLKNQGKRFLDCFDIDPSRSKFTSQFYGYQSITDIELLISNPKCKTIYIASNHSTHTDYAVKALKAGKDVYIEKPISVNKDQFNELLMAVSESSNRVFAGYNRPYSRSIKKVDSFIQNTQEPLSLNCFVSGHLIESDHWYRDEKEGTRICGNVGHWIDIMVHLMNIRGCIPEIFDISIAKANEDEQDDNLVISISTDFKDITSIFITSRTEPFEGINETINIQCGDVISKIDDFKSITIWKNDFKYSKRYYRKDVGHEKAINQPFLPSAEVRDWKEVKISTTIMLEITEMVKTNVSHKKIKI